MTLYLYRAVVEFEAPSSQAKRTEDASCAFAGTCVQAAKGSSSLIGWPRAR